MTDIKASASADSNLRALHKEWDEASCPICMDHPHNAVLILCSSHDKGCRSYICDTSYRHSNCLDRFKKLKVESRSSPSQPSSSSLVESLDNGRLAGQSPLHNLSPGPIFGGPRMQRNLVENHDDYSSEETNDGISTRLVATQEENYSQDPGRYSETQRVGIGPDLHRERTVVEELGDGSFLDSTSHLKCPLCRGSVRGFEIVKEARQHLDLKQRSCSRESCSFTGNYRELRRHARRVHPTTRPADVDPSRQRAWRHLEHQREYGDIVSAIRSAMPGAIVLGDYVIDSGDRLSGDGETGPIEGSGPWWTTFFLFHMVGPMASVDEPRRLSRAWRRHRRSSGAFSGRRNLWGENLLGLQDDDEDWNLGSDDMGDDVPVPRRRRRLSRSRSVEDRP
ncbi:hypothetical protein MRB53_020237 [Persea americana]|uniref:Uncharacterized protein n=1 Tax=Persea americana TaxID=3435 RepID=A0ACC2L0X1_PERAE|nr:hypothetical protein MRB53_020237 [Persea americana]